MVKSQGKPPETQKSRMGRSDRISDVAVSTSHTRRLLVLIRQLKRLFIWECELFVYGGTAYGGWHLADCDHSDFISHTISWQFEQLGRICIS